MRTTAQITIKADARSLNKVARQMEDAFDPARAEGLKQATDDLNTTLDETSEQASDLATALEDAAKTADAFKKLKDQIKAVRQEAQRLNQELSKGGGTSGGRRGGLGDLVRRGAGAFKARPTGAYGEKAGGTPAGSTEQTPADKTPGGGSGRGMGALSAGASAIPYLGMAIGAMMMLGSQGYQSHLGREGARRGTYAARANRFGQPLIGARAQEDVGGAFGYDPATSQGMYGSFMSQAGRPFGASAFRTAMGAQQGWGVDTATSGGLMQGFRRAGGENNAEAMQSFTKTLSAAVTMGLDGAELTGYMQQTAGMVAQQVEIGQRELDMMGFHTVERELGGEVGGLQAARITRGFAQGVSELGYSGGGGATEFQLAHAAGYRPGQGMDAYFEALQKMQDVGRNPELMSKYLERFMGEGAPSGEHTRIAMIQRAMQAVGVRVHADTARRIAGGDQGAIDEVMLGDVGKARGVHGDLITEAGFEADRADKGVILAESMQNLTIATLSMMDAVVTMEPILLKTTEVIAQMAVGAGVVAEEMMKMPEYMKQFFDWLDKNTKQWPF